jgi:hypothetical protein
MSGQQDLNRVEIGVYAFVLALIAIGIVLSRTDLAFLEERYIVEDGLIEWLAVVGFAAGAIVCFRRVLRLRGRRPRRFLAVTLLLGLAFFFCAGEEISWGQRLFGIESSEWFRANNAQEETNLHNIRIGEVKLNKLIFSKGLAVGMLLYLAVLSPLYGARPAVRRRVDAWGIPIPKIHHIIAVVVMFLLAQGLVASTRKGELAEFGGAFLFLMIVAFPANGSIYRAEGAPSARLLPPDGDD